jgi:hypothetical protein
VGITGRGALSEGSGERQKALPAAEEVAWFPEPERQWHTCVLSFSDRTGVTEIG